MKPKLHKYDVLLITWDDACGQSGWNKDEKDLLEPHICHTVGMFLDQTKERVLVCGNICPSAGNHGDYMSLPKGMIKRMQVLKRAAR